MLLLVPLLLLATGVAAPDADPLPVYRRACVACHGADGTGKGAGGTRLPGRNLTEPRWQARRKDEVLVASILEGRGAMPSFKARMTREEAQRMVEQVIRPLAKGLSPARVKR